MSAAYIEDFGSGVLKTGDLYVGSIQLLFPPFIIFVTNENGQKENIERKCGIGNGDFQVGFNLSLSGGGEIGGVQIRIQPTRPTGRCRCPNYLE